MFEKKVSVPLNNFKTFNAGVLTSGLRVAFLDSNDILVVSNDEEHLTFIRYDASGSLLSEMTVDYEYGHLAGVTLHKEALWLEFRDVVAMYEERYSIVKLTPTDAELIYVTNRESYMHDLPYHCLFVEDGELYLNMIRHNRMHHYKISGMLEEIDVQEGGKWYLCGRNPLCIMGATLELYDSHLNIINTIEYDDDIDELVYKESSSPAFFAMALTDLSQEQTTLLIHHFDTQSMHIAYIENAIADMGVSSGRIWLNPYGFNMQQEFGGCMIYDRFAWPVYVHMRAKAQVGSIGAYPPPFHRSEGIYPAPDGQTLVAEPGRLLLFDYNCRAVQDIVIPNPDCIAVSANGMFLAVLNLDRNSYLQEKTSTSDAVLEIYTWNHAYEGDKVVEMVRFRDKEGL